MTTKKPPRPPLAPGCKVHWDISLKAHTLEERRSWTTMISRTVTKIVSEKADASVVKQQQPKHPVGHDRSNTLGAIVEVEESSKAFPKHPERMVQ